MVESVNRLRELGRVVDDLHRADPRQDNTLAETRARLVGGSSAGAAALGHEIDQAHGDMLSSRDDLREVRGRLLRPAPRDRRALSRWVWAGPALAAAAALVALLAWPDAEPPLGFQVDGQPGTPRMALASEGRKPTVLAFSDGSEVALKDHAAARVLEVLPNGARVALRRGTLAVHVVPKPRTRWRFDAGPFQVHVLGTRFEVAWDPGDERFALSLKRGKVRIVGPAIGTRLVEAGESVTVWLGQERVRVVKADGSHESTRPDTPKDKAPAARPAAAKLAAPDLAAPALAAPVLAAPDLATARPMTTSPAGADVAAEEPPVVAPAVSERLAKSRLMKKMRRASAAPSQPAPTPPSKAPDPAAPAIGSAAAHSEPPPGDVQPEPAPVALPPAAELARAGRYDEAVAAAAGVGWQRWMAQADRADLLVVADAARFSRDSSRATRLYVYLRSRAPGSTQAAAAAFALGQLAFDQRRDYNAAAAWFGRYLVERPTGSLAREAAGRLLEARLKADDHAGACAAARKYMVRHASGPHANLARETASTCNSAAAAGAP